MYKNPITIYYFSLNLGENSQNFIENKNHIFEAGIQISIDLLMCQKFSRTIIFFQTSAQFTFHKFIFRYSLNWILFEKIYIFSY